MAGSCLSFAKSLIAFQHNLAFEACIKCCTENLIFTRIGPTWLLLKEYLTLQNISLRDIQCRQHLVTIHRTRRFGGCDKPASYSKDRGLNTGYSVSVNPFVILAIQLFHHAQTARDCGACPEAKTALANHSHRCQIWRWLRCCLAVMVTVFLDVFVKFRKATISFVCLYRFPIKGFSWNLIWEHFFLSMSRKFKSYWNLTRITGTLREDVRTYVRVS